MRQVWITGSAHPKFWISTSPVFGVGSGASRSSKVKASGVNFADIMARLGL